jgi:hypothetical protein
MGRTLEDAEDESDTCAFVRVDKAHYRDFLGYARWYYRGDDFETLQVVWPDKEDRLPWEKGVARWMAERQPVLATRVEPPTRSARGRSRKT